MQNSQDPAEAMRAIQAAMDSMQQMEKNRTGRPTKSTSPAASTAPNQTSNSRRTASKALPTKTKKNLNFGQWLSRFIKSSLVAVSFILISPLMLVKAALFLHMNEGLNAYLSLAAATGANIILTALVVGIFLVVTTKKTFLKASFKLISFAWLIILIPLMLWSGLAGSKDANTASEYQSAHPLLKMAVSTHAIFDKQIIMTDISRTRADYIKMGLPEATYSKHFKQDDGYVHAVDIRTIGRSKWQNKLADFSFRFMGFKTLRHVGTADHLHISMP